MFLRKCTKGQCVNAPACCCPLPVRSGLGLNCSGKEESRITCLRRIEALGRALGTMEMGAKHPHPSDWEIFRPMARLADLIKAYAVK